MSREIDLQAVVDAALRTNFIFFLRKAFGVVSAGDRFVPNWHLEAIAWRLEQVRSGDVTQLTVTMPPRYLKSVTISVAWVAWMLGKDPSLRFVCVSYSADLAAKHATDCRAIMQSDWYRRIFPKTRLRGSGGSVMDFATTKGGGRLSTSVGGTLTGRGGDIIVIDDPIKPDDANSETMRERVRSWYSNTLVSRLNDKSKGAIILVMQRVHEEDLAGHLLKAGGQTHLSLPAVAEADEEIPVGEGRVHRRREGEALHPERESLDRLGHNREVMGSAVFSAQYQQAPVPAGGLVVQRDWFRYYDNEPGRRPGDQIVQSWDTATKDGALNDYSVCITALKRGRLIYVLDVFRGKLNFPDLKRKVVGLAQYWQANTLLIEDAASGAQLIQQLREDNMAGIPRPLARRPEGDKASRLWGQTARIEAGEMLLPRDAAWRADFERELLGFPNARHDDQVDALSQLLAWSGQSTEPNICFGGAQLIVCND